jgi:hypothetical protein
MTKATIPYILSAIELPPVNEADAEARAAREANCKAFIETQSAPTDLALEAIYELMERTDAFAVVFDTFILETVITGEIDLPRFRELQAEQGRLRHEFLSLIGAAPESDELMERPVELLHRA